MKEERMEDRMLSMHVMYECFIYIQNANKHIKEKKNIYIFEISIKFSIF
jgi:hypothetical protein